MRRLISMLIVLFISHICLAGNIYIDTDVSGGTGDGSSWANAYSTTAAAVAAKAGVLAADANFYAKASSGTHDTASITVTGYTQGDFYLNFYFDSSYVLDVTNDEGMYVTGNTTNIRINGLNCNVTETGTKDAYGIRFSGMLVDTNNVYISNCKIIGDCNGTGNGFGIKFDDAECQIATITNCVIAGFKSGTDTGFAGIQFVYGISHNIYNCTISNNFYGITSGSISYVATNCVIFNSGDNTKDYFFSGGTHTVTYTASDETIAGTGNIDWDNAATDWAAAFTDYENNDFTLKEDSSLIGTGTDLSGAGVTTDILGVTRTVPFDIGAYKYGVAGVPAVRKPRIININMN